MSEPIDNIMRKHLDVFKEIGNIGAGNAATALAGILNRKIDMSVPDAQVVPFSSIVDIMDGPETPVVGILIDVSGEINGYILLLLGMDEAKKLVSLALSEASAENILTASDFNSMERDTILEIANIIVGSFLSAISTFTELGATPSVPQMTIDMLGAIISIAAIEYGQIGDFVLFLKTQFFDDTGDLAGHFFLIPDYNSYRILLDSLGLDI